MSSVDSNAQQRGGQASGDDLSEALIEMQDLELSSSVNSAHVQPQDQLTGLNDLPNELIIRILEMLSTKAWKRGYLICFGLTNKKHWACFRRLHPDKIHLNYTRGQELLRSWMNPSYRYAKGSCRFCYLARNIYGDERGIKEVALENRWKVYNELGHGEKILPKPYNYGESDDTWYLEAAQALKIEVASWDPSYSAWSHGNVSIWERYRITGFQQWVENYMRDKDLREGIERKVDGFGRDTLMAISD